MNVNLYDFELPEQLIAQTPLLDRTASRLLTLNKDSGEINHQTFPDIIDFLDSGDTLILNDTRVLPARLFGTKEDTGAKAEVLLLKMWRATSGKHWLSRVKAESRFGYRIWRRTEGNH